MDANETTFNDMPKMIGKIFQKIERVEQMLYAMRDNFEDTIKNKSSSEHIPMTLDEACEFLRMKKSGTVA